MTQTLPYERRVCSSGYCSLSSLHELPATKRSILSRAIEEVRNIKVLTKTALVADPAILLSPSGRRTTAVCCHRWEHRASQLYHIRTQQRKMDRAPVFRQQYFARPFMHAALTVKARRLKEQPDNSQILECLSDADC